MRNPIRNTLSVLAATMFTAFAVYGGVQFAGNVIAPETTAVAMSGAGDSSSSSGTLTCPRTGCTASSCHATQGGGGQRGW